MSYDPKQEAEEAVGDRRPGVDVTNQAEAADWLRDELGRGELSGVFLREDMLVHTPRIGEDGYIDPEKLGLKDAGPAQVRPISTAGIKALIETRYAVWRWQGQGDDRRQVHCLFPVGSANSACDAARTGEFTPNLRKLHSVTHTPTIRPDGSILDQPGYDAETGLLYMPEPGLDVPVIPDEPTREEVTAAVDLILEPIAEFPFVSEDDRATWIGLAFTPILRPLFPPPYQMGVITATNPGSGKTFLSKMLVELHGGALRGEMPRAGDELRKGILSTLIDTTAPIVVFDNLRGVVRSAELESLLTSRTFTDRWLGQNKQATGINDRLWMATGNNAQFGGDLGRRMAIVSLDPPTAGHHLRTDFKISGPINWMHDTRGAYLAALLTVARGWVNADRPTKRVRSDDYAAWMGGLRGLMEWAGFKGVFGGSDTDVVASSDDEEWGVFLEALAQHFPGQPLMVKDIVSSLRRRGVWNPELGQWSQHPDNLDPALLPGSLATDWDRISRIEGSDSGFRKSLGHWCRNHAGRWSGDLKLHPVGTNRTLKQPVYEVIRKETAPAAPS
jgi:hypothetical protein